MADARTLTVIIGAFRGGKSVILKYDQKHFLGSLKQWQNSGLVRCLGFDWKDMDRLTKDYKDGSFGVADNLPCGENSYTFKDLLINTLGKYERAEEQGLLFRPICKVGDTVYFVPSKFGFALNILNKAPENNRARKQVVYEIRILKDDCMYVTYDEMFGMLQSSFGETWFLTEEEAEAKLEELRGKKD